MVLRIQRAVRAGATWLVHGLVADAYSLEAVIRRLVDALLARWSATLELAIALGSAVLFVLFATRSLPVPQNPWEYIITLAGLVISIGSYVSHHRRLKESVLVTEFTLAKLAEADRPGASMLDRILGRLIAGTWKIRDLQPSSALFRVLDQAVRSTNYELKRRIAEALPALARIDRARTLELISVLRTTYDAGDPGSRSEWRADNRRRTVEAIDFRSWAPKKVVQFLKWYPRDQGYTAIAVAEVIHGLRRYDRVRSDELMRQLLDDWTREELDSGIAAVPGPVTEGLHRLIGLLNTPRNNRYHRELLSMMDSPNEFVQVAATRNIWRLGRRFDRQKLELMAQILEGGHYFKQARRPIAREHSVDFLIRCLLTKDLSDKARRVLEDLMEDADDIIPRTTLDKADRLLGIDPGLVTELCGLIPPYDSWITRERAEIIVKEPQPRI